MYAEMAIIMSEQRETARKDVRAVNGGVKSDHWAAQK